MEEQETREIVRKLARDHQLLHIINERCSSSEDSGSQSGRNSSKQRKTHFKAVNRSHKSGTDVYTLPVNLLVPEASPMSEESPAEPKTPSVLNLDMQDSEECKSIALARDEEVKEAEKLIATVQIPPKIQLNNIPKLQKQTKHVITFDGQSSFSDDHETFQSAAEAA